MGTTPRFDFPFPEDSDAPDGPGQLEALANAIEAVLTPPGTILATAAPAAPAGYLLCDGSSVSRATYADLFAEIGTTYGTADGSHFNLPDLRGRVPVGVDGAAARLTANDTLAAHSGEEKHTLGTSEIPSHDHPPGTNQAGFWGSGVFGGSFQVSLSGSHNMVELTRTGVEGGGGSHNNMQPYQVVNFMIKV